MKAFPTMWAALCLCATVCVPASGAESVAAEADVRTLQRVALDREFTPGRDVLMDVVVIPPGTALDRHWHPGEEFHYYMEGEVTIEIDGQAPIIGRPGGHGHVPFRKHHRAIAGPAGAKILVVRVHTTGEPWRYLVEDAQAVAGGTQSASPAVDDGSRRPAIHRVLVELDDLLPADTAIDRFLVDDGAVRIYGKARDPRMLVAALNGSRAFARARLGSAMAPGAESRVESFVVEAATNGTIVDTPIAPGANWEESSAYLQERLQAAVSKHARDPGACTIVMTQASRLTHRYELDPAGLRVRLRCEAKELRAVLADLETTVPALLVDEVAIRNRIELGELLDVAFMLIAYRRPPGVTDR